MKDADFGIIIHASKTTSDDGPRQPIWLVGKKKAAFDIATEKDTFFEVKHVIGRNLCKMPIIDMPFAFDPSIEVGPSR